MDVIVAARLSQAGDRETGIDTQDQDAKRWAEREGHHIVAVIPDHKTGAADWMDRKHLRPWLTDPVKLAAYQGIVAASQDRLSRGKWRDEIAIRMWAEDNGKELFICDTQLHWPPRDVGEQIRWELDASRAREEWEKASKRYRRAQAWLRDNDYLVGRPPYGYRVAPVPGSKHKTLEIDPDTAYYVAEIFEKVCGLWPLVKIARWLESEGVPSAQGGHWTPKSLAQILRNPVYIGRRKDASGKTILRCPPVVETATWRQVQALLDRRTSHHVGIASENTAMLTNVAFCAKCAGPMFRIKSGRWYGGQRKEYHYYRCHGTDRHPSTCSNLIPVAELDAWVDAKLSLLADVELVEERLIKGDDHADAIADVEDEIRDLDLDDPAYDQRHAELRAERQRLKALPREADRLERVFTGISIADHWKTLDGPARRDYLLGDGVKVCAVKTGGVLHCRLEAESEAYVTLTRSVSSAELNDTAPKGDTWNLAAAEILPAAP